MIPESMPIRLSEPAEALVKQWSADDRLWSTKETVEFNLRLFARAILAMQLPATPERTKRIPFETFKGPTCKGSIVLGNACGQCERCAWERQQLGREACQFLQVREPLTEKGTTKA